MENNKKYRYEQASKEQIEAFNVEFQALLGKHQLVAETQPQMARVGETGEFCLKGALVLSRAIEIVEAEKVEEVVSPLQKDDLNTTA